jgi:hypothetical protein
MNLRHDAKVVYKTGTTKYGETTYWRDYFDKNFTAAMEQVVREFSKKGSGQLVKFSLERKTNFLI